MKNKQNNRKFLKSSEKDKTGKQTTRHHRSDFSSMISETGKNSLCSASPKVNQTNPLIQKYNTYMEFITSNKITPNELCNGRNSDMFEKKKAVTPTPRKNSPLPYHRGRKSAFSKLYSNGNMQPCSPKSLGITQRQINNKCVKKESNKQKNSFVVYGNSTNRKRDSLELKLKTGNNEKKKKKEVSSKRQKFMSKGKSKQDKKDINKESLDSEFRIEREEEKLFNKLFKGIQFYRDLGRGAHALVRSAVDWNSKRKIAIKVYEKSQLSEDELKSIERQIQILTGLNHTNIIRLYEIIETYKTINLIMEYGGGNSLDQYMKSKPDGRLQEREAKFIFKQVVEAVQYLHEMKVTHRDIKTENILLNKHLNLKIIDFGFSLICHPQKHISSYCGTPTYMPPEVVSKTPHNPQLADRWSLGVLLFTILNGHCPFRASTQKELFVKINSGQFQYPVQVNPKAKQIIEHFMKKTPEERLSPAEALTHPWLQKCQGLQ